MNSINFLYGDNFDVSLIVAIGCTRWSYTEKHVHIIVLIV